MSIQVDLNGLSFFILNSDSNAVVQLISNPFETKQTPNRLLNHLEHAFNTHQALQKKFSKVQIIHSNAMQTLVPSALFDEAALSDYIKYNTKIFKTDFITYDVIQNEDIMVVYVPLVNINNFIFERFGSFEYKHSATILIDRVLQWQKNSSDTIMFVNIEHKRMTIVVTNGNHLTLYNSFDCNTAEDFIYYILFTAEQLNLNPEEFKCQLMGSISENDNLYTMAYTYIRHVSILPYNKMRYHDNKTTAHFTLLNSL